MTYYTANLCGVLYQSISAYHPINATTCPKTLQSPLAATSLTKQFYNRQLNDCITPSKKIQPKQNANFTHLQQPVLVLIFSSSFYFVSGYISFISATQLDSKVAPSESAPLQHNRGVWPNFRAWKALQLLMVAERSLNIFHSRFTPLECTTGKWIGLLSEFETCISEFDQYLAYQKRSKIIEVGEKKLIISSDQCDK